MRDFILYRFLYKIFYRFYFIKSIEHCSSSSSYRSLTTRTQKEVEGYRSKNVSRLTWNPRWTNMLRAHGVPKASRVHATGISGNCNDARMHSAISPMISACAWVRNATCCRPLSSGTSCARLETSGTIPSGYNGPLVPRIVRRLHYTRPPSYTRAYEVHEQGTVYWTCWKVYIYIYLFMCVYTYMERERYPRKCEWIRWCCSAISLCGCDSATSSGYYYTEVGYSVVVASRCYYTSVILAISGALM